MTCDRCGEPMVVMRADGGYRRWACVCGRKCDEFKMPPYLDSLGAALGRAFDETIRRDLLGEEPI